MLFPFSRTRAAIARQWPAKEIPRHAVQAQVEKLQPVAQSPIGNQVIATRWQPGTGNQPAQSPENARLEAQHDQVTVGALHTMYLTQNGMWTIAEIQCVWQQHAINRIVRNGQAMHLANCRWPELSSCRG